MSTIYTVNGKVLKNSDTGKWLTKKEAPAGFVMNASNATYKLSGTTLVYVIWQGPAYPDFYNGNGKQYILVNNNAEVPNCDQFMYSPASSEGGPDAISKSDMKKLGTSTGVMLNNYVPASQGYGARFVWPLRDMTIEQAQAYMANVTITIVDP